MSSLRIERLGGLAGFGGANLKSEGRLAIADLSPEDQKRVEELFAAGSKPPVANTNDMFSYRITRDKDGHSETIEVPESAVPAALVESVKDGFR